MRPHANSFSKRVKTVQKSENNGDGSICNKLNMIFKSEPLKAGFSWKRQFTFL